MHTVEWCALPRSNSAPKTQRCKAQFWLLLLRCNVFQVQRTTGMSDDVPASKNTSTKGFMRFVFRPELPAEALTHKWDGRLTK